MNLNKNILLITIPRLGLILFVFLNLISMLLYAGGTINNPNTLNYLFLYNFLSDLGRIVSHSGNINFHSSLFFNMSLILAGIVFIIFYIFLLNLFNENIKIIIFSRIGSLFGVLGGICLAGIGLSPSDLYLNFHIHFAHWLFRFLFICSICYSLVIYYDKNILTQYAFGYILFALSIGLYILVSELGPNAKSSLSALLFQVVAQKIILFIFLNAIYIQTLGIQKFKLDYNK